jgi:GTP-dependent phosphoenolpyruvate carboxykinase
MIFAIGSVRKRNSNISIFLQIKTRRMKTWEERFTEQMASAESTVGTALKKGHVETANRIAMRVHKRAKKGGFVSSFTVLLHLENPNSKTRLFQSQAS